MITSKPFDTYKGEQIYKYTLQDKISVDVITLGATITAIRTPDRNGNMVDVALCHTSSAAIAASKTYMGAVVGRCANRIAGGRFALDGRTYSLATNDNGNHLHGGNVGFNQKVFSAEVQGNSLILSYMSRDGEENYPSILRFSVKYTVEGSCLSIDYDATSNGSTLINPTNHAYFNLNGEDDGDIYDNLLQINASKFLPINPKLIPTGEERSVAGTPFDFTKFKPIGMEISAADLQLVFAGGYDHNYCLDGEHAATAYSRKTGIRMDVFTDMCGLQFYSGNFIFGERGKSLYHKRAGFCLETQFYPNAINNPLWKQPILRSGEKFHSQTRYQFSVDEISL